jgi:hypothetical protein
MKNNMEKGNVRTSENRYQLGNKWILAKGERRLTRGCHSCIAGAVKRCISW